jgi:hypothetical protein
MAMGDDPGKVESNDPLDVVVRIDKRIDTVVAGMATLGERIDQINRLVKSLFEEGSALQKAQRTFERGLDVLEATLKIKTVALEDAQATTDKMMGVLDTRVGRLRDEVIEEKEARLASSVPPPPHPPSEPTLPEDRKTDPIGERGPK